MIIVTTGRGMETHLLYEIFNEVMLEKTEEALAEMFNSSPSVYDEHWNIDNKMLIEERVQKAQSYKKKNQRHPAFRK